MTIDTSPVPLRHDRREPPGAWAAMFRVYVSLSVAVTCYIAIVSPFSLQRMAFAADKNDVGWYVLYTLAFLSALGLADSIVNDFLPDKWKFEWARANRHMLFMMMAIGLCSVIFVNLHHGFFFGLMHRYFVDLSACITVGSLDVVGRVRHARCAGRSFA